jgi:phosphoserine phosphatase
LNILDIGQAVIHDYLSLGILVEIPVEHQSSSVLKDLLFTGHSLQVSITFTPIELDRYEQWVSEKGKEGLP